MSDEFIYTFESAEVIVSHIPALNRRKSSNFPFRSVILHKYTIFSYICQTITEKNRRSRYITQSSVFRKNRYSSPIIRIFRASNSVFTSFPSWVTE